MNPRQTADSFFKENQFNVPLPAIVLQLEELCTDIDKCSRIIQDATFEWGSAIYNLQFFFVKELRALSNLVSKSPHVDVKEQQLLRSILLDLNNLRMKALNRIGVTIQTTHI
jgi:hypothetical protein